MNIYSNKAFSSLKNSVKEITKVSDRELRHMPKDLDKISKEKKEIAIVSTHNLKIFTELRNIQKSAISDKYLIGNKDKELKTASENFDVEIIKEIISKIEFSNSYSPNLKTVSEIIGEEIKFQWDNGYLLDTYIGVYLHHYLGINRAQASRPEFWNSLLLVDELILDYCIFRSQFARKKPQKVKLSYFIVEGEQNLIVEHLLARQWWAVELFRNGKNYPSAIEALSLGSMFTRRWGPMSLIHSKLFGLASANLLLKTSWPKKLGKYKDGRRYAIQNLPVIFNNYAATKNFDKEFRINQIENPDSHDIWREKRFKKFENKITKLFGPDDIEIKKSSIDKGTKILKDLARSSVSTETKYGPQKFL